MADWLPTREQDFVDVCHKWITILEQADKISAYSWDAIECKAVLEKVSSFVNARKAYEHEDSSAKRLVKDDAKRAAIAFMRDFVNASVRFNKKMDEAAKLALGIKPKDASPSSRPRPTSQPDAVVENTRNHFEHQVKALNRETGATGKPADAYGVHYAWQVGGTRPTTAEDLPKGQFNRRTYFVLTHTEADKGKLAFYACRYQNGKGEAGPWSPVVEAYIG